MSEAERSQLNKIVDQSKIIVGAIEKHEKNIEISKKIFELIPGKEIVEILKKAIKLNDDYDNMIMYYVYLNIPDEYKTFDMIKYIVELDREKHMSEPALRAGFDNFNVPEFIDFIAKSVSPEYLNDELCSELLKFSSEVLNYIPENQKTTKMFLQACKAEDFNRGSSNVLSMIPSDSITEEMCLEAISKSESEFKNIPQRLLSSEFIEKLLKRNGNVIGEIPKDKINLELCRVAVSSNGGAIIFIPEEFRNRELYHIAFKQIISMDRDDADDSLVPFLHTVPSEFITEDILQQIISKVPHMIDLLADGAFSSVNQRMITNEMWMTVLKKETNPYYYDLYENFCKKREEMENLEDRINKLKSNTLTQVLPVSILTLDQVHGEKELDIFKKIGASAKPTDFDILLGGSGYFALKKAYVDRGRYGEGFVIHNYVIAENEKIASNVRETQYHEYRPTLDVSSVLDQLDSNIEVNGDGICKIKYGAYPQTLADDQISNELEVAYNSNRLKRTGMTYSNYSMKNDECDDFVEYEYSGDKYVRVSVDDNHSSSTLSNGKKIENNQTYWVRVEPLVWLVDFKEKIAVSEKVIYKGKFQPLVDEDGRDFSRYLNYGSVVSSDAYDHSQISQFLNQKFIFEIFGNQKITINDNDNQINQSVDNLGQHR